MTALPRPLRLAIINDYEVIVAGLAAVLSTHDPQIRVIELNSRVPAVSDVDIVLLDTFAFASGGLIEVRELAAHARRSDAKVVVYSWVTDPGSVQDALAQGAAGHLWKGLDAAELIGALDDIRSGQVVVRGPALRPEPGEDAAGPAQARWPGRDLGLTAREAEVVALIAKGMSNEEIAGELFLGINTIKTYIRTAYRRIGVTSRTQAVLWAVHHGFDMHAGRTFPAGREDPGPGPGDRRLPTPRRAPGVTPSPERLADVGAEFARRAARVTTLVPQCLGMTLASTERDVSFTVVASSPEVAALDAVQYLSSGPCVTAAEAGRVLTCRRDELAQVPTWGPFAEATAAAGVSSTLSLPLARDGKVVGTVNLYGATDDAFEASQEAVAAEFEDWAPRAASEARLPERRVTVENMAQHLDDDLDIKAATSRLARERTISLHRARQQLDDAAHRAGVTKAELARTVRRRPGG
jgi:NarL family two-component system response regulator LiaR